MGWLEAAAGMFDDKSGGGGGAASALGGILGMTNPWMMGINALGGLLGNNAAMEHLQTARNDILNLPGMQGPTGLGGSWGQVGANGQMQLGAGQQGALNMMSGQYGNLFGGGNAGMFNPAINNLNIGNQAQNVNNQLAQQMGAMNGISGMGAGGLFGMGMNNMMNAQNQQGLYNQSLDVMRQAAQPEQQRTQNRFMDQMYNMGLLGPNTNVQSGNGAARAMFDSFGQQDLGFQNQAFDRMANQQQFLGNMGMNQVGQGLGAEAQAFRQQLGALQQNQGAALQGLGAAQGLLGAQGNLFAQMFGLGQQGLETQLGFNDFGLRASAMPQQLQAQLLQGGGYHAGALANLGQGMADQSGGFFSGMFG